jgi:hypothetical protein
LVSLPLLSSLLVPLYVDASPLLLLVVVLLLLLLFLLVPSSSLQALYVAWDRLQSLTAATQTALS